MNKYRLDATRYRLRISNPLDQNTFGDTEQRVRYGGWWLTIDGKDRHVRLFRLWRKTEGGLGWPRTFQNADGEIC